MMRYLQHDLLASRAVSYTHLDVYKRQAHDVPANASDDAVEQPAAKRDIAGAPVSYTHLDKLSPVENAGGRWQNASDRRSRYRAAFAHHPVHSLAQGRALQAVAGTCLLYTSRCV